MKYIVCFLIVVACSQILKSQILEVEGAINIQNESLFDPEEGTIRFNQSTFEGFNGNAWKALSKSRYDLDCQGVDISPPQAFLQWIIAVTLPAPAGVATINAADLDINSHDNCGGELAFGFVDDFGNLVSSIQFDCSDIPDGISEIVAANVLVFDESGNLSVASVLIDLMDTDDQCDDGDTGAEAAPLAALKSQSIKRELILDFISKSRKAEVSHK